MKRYYRKIIIYSEEKESENVTAVSGEFETIEDITDKKKELIEQYGYF